MPAPTDDATAIDWDAHAADYARLFAPLTGHVERSIVALVEGHLPNAARILDIACGPGDIAVAAAQLCAERGGDSVLATDISPAMVALTGGALAPVSADAKCEVRDGQALGLEGGHFDAAFSLVFRDVPVPRSPRGLAVRGRRIAASRASCDIRLARPGLQ